MLAAQRASVAPQGVGDDPVELRRTPRSLSRSATGTTRGGSLVIRALAVHQLGQPAGGPGAVPGHRLLHLAVELPGRLRRRPASAHRSRTSSELSREYQTCSMPSSANSRIACRYAAHAECTTVRAVTLVEAPVPARDLEARGQPLDVPLPGSRNRLVEVVEVEHQVPLGRGVAAEVRQVRVPAQLDLDPGRGRRGEVRGHHRGAAPEEGERGGEHPPVPQRDQLLDPSRRCRRSAAPPGRSDRGAPPRPHGCCGAPRTAVPGPASSAAPGSWAARTGPPASCPGWSPFWLVGGATSFSSPAIRVPDMSSP